MKFLRSEQAAAALLLIAAIAGLSLANSALGPTILSVKATAAPIPGIGVQPTIGEWITDGLLVVFFFLVAIELRHEFTFGSLNSIYKALRPAIAAIAGVAVPAVLYAIIAAPAGLAHGWPVPTATDIAFALGALALLGRGLPPSFRAFLLALAIFDDLIGIMLIAIFLGGDLDALYILAAGLGITAFIAAGRLWHRFELLGSTLMLLCAIATWAFTYLSGIHATIAGVALGLSMSAKPAAALAHKLQPLSNLIVLPIFAFTSAAVAIPAVAPDELTSAFWAPLIALPVGKIVGITLGGLIGYLTVIAAGEPRPSLLALLALGSLGGIGFTVSLLMNELAFRGQQLLIDEGTLGVLAGSLIALVFSAITVPLLALRSRGRSPQRSPQPTQ